MTPRKGEKEKGGGRFPEGSWEVLQSIIIDGQGGKWREIVASRDLRTHYLKAKAWNDITTEFNKVLKWIEALL